MICARVWSGSGRVAIGKASGSDRVQSNSGRVAVEFFWVTDGIGIALICKVIGISRVYVELIGY